MQKRFRILSLLLVLSMVLSPISTVFSDIVNAQEDNLEVVDVIEEVDRLEEIEGDESENSIPDDINTTDEGNSGMEEEIGDLEEEENKEEVEDVEGIEEVEVFGLDSNSEEPEQVEDFYQLKTKENLFWFAEKINDTEDERINGELLNDIDLENEPWTPIETFTGEFNGNGYTINNININATAATQGFIRINEGTVRDFKLTGNISSNKNVLGGITGRNKGIISDIENYANVVNDVDASNSNTGGIAGANEGIIKRVLNYGQVEGRAIVGGIVGSEEGRIYSAANFGTVSSRTGFNEYAGGIVGAINLNKSSTIYNVYNRGNVYGGTRDLVPGRAGGIVGFVQNNATLNLTNAYNTGQLTAYETNPISPSGDIKNTYYIADETDWTNGEVSEEDFKSVDIIEKLNSSDHIEVENEDEFVFTKDDYPTLRWQGLESAETPKELKDLQKSADFLKVTVESTPNELTSPVTDTSWIKLIHYDPTGDYAISVSWESSNDSLISIDSSYDMGSITLPKEGEEEVTLTATLSKGGYKLEKQFVYILTKNKTELSEDEKILEEAVESLEWFRLNINSDQDANVNVHMENVLKNKEFEDIAVSTKSSNREDLIDLNGDIHYIFDESYLKAGLPYDRQTTLTFEFTKGEAKRDYSIRTMVGWDRDRVKQVIEEKIIQPLSQDLIGDNESFDKIKEGFEVPGSIEYTGISWQSSDATVLKIEPGLIPLYPSNIKVIRGIEDKEVVLTAKITFNHDDIEIEEKYSLTVLALSDGNELATEMQELLDENYTDDKLKNFTNKEAIDVNSVKDDISLIRPRETGIKGYDNYQFKVTSDSDTVVINNNPISYRAYVYRPLPGQEAEDVNLTVEMKHKDKGIAVTKIIPVKVTPLSQEEIDAEIHLMNLVKENYFEGMKGDNTSSNEIKENLKAFREVNLIDNELIWTYHIDDDRNTGIYPDEIEGWENQEQWRLFRSSHPQIIRHENLLVYKPEYTTDVTIESTLSSKVYGKYATRHPEVEDFQKLYRQDMSITVTVIGENDKVLGEPSKVEIVNKDINILEIGDKLELVAEVYNENDEPLSGQGLTWSSSNKSIATVKDGNVEGGAAGEAIITVKVKDTDIQDSFTVQVIDEIKTLEVNTAIIVFNEDGGYEIKFTPKTVDINKDEHDGGLTVFGALQATTSEYEETKGWISSIYGIKGPETGGWMFSVNGQIPDVGAGQAKLSEGDKVIWFCTYDHERNQAPTWEELIGQEPEEPEEKLAIKIISNKTSLKVGEELPLVAEVSKGDTILTYKEIMWLSSNAEIATIEDGKLIAHKAGEVNITAVLAEDKDIKDTLEIKVVEKDKEDLTIKEVIESLRLYYSSKDEFTFRQALGYNYTSNNLEKDLLEIGTKISIKEDASTAADLAGNVISIIAAGKDPYNYGGNNYVGRLAQTFDANDWPTSLAFRILALDMAGTEYDRDIAIETLTNSQDEEGKWGGQWGGPDEVGMVITALAKYKDIQEVEESINKGLDYLKGEQDGNTGGFIVWGSENPYSASAVLQGLIAVGEDPLSESWTKNGNTIVDSLMNFYNDGYFVNDGREDEMATEQGFIALADLYRGKSMFNEIKFNGNEVASIKIIKPAIDKIIEGDILSLSVTGYDNEGKLVPVKEIIWTSSDKDIAEVDKNGKVTSKKSGQVTISAQVKGTDIEDSIVLEIYEKEFEIEYIGDAEIRNGQQVNVRIQLRNLTTRSRPASLIVALYDKNTNKLLNYSIVKKELVSKEELELAAGFLVPEIGDYYIKVLLWDDLQEQNIIMQEAKDIKVAG